MKKINIVFPFLLFLMCFTPVSSQTKCEQIQTLSKALEIDVFPEEEYHQIIKYKCENASLIIQITFLTIYKETSDSTYQNTIYEIPFDKITKIENTERSLKIITEPKTMNLYMGFNEPARNRDPTLYDLFTANYSFDHLGLPATEGFDSDKLQELADILRSMMK